MDSFYNTKYVGQPKSYHPYIAHPLLLMFEFETKVWSEIRVNFPSNGIYYQIYVDVNAILSVITYSKIDETSDETSELRTALIRIPLKKPDRLTNLCWFRTRECGFSNKFAHLIF